MLFLSKESDVFIARHNLFTADSKLTTSQIKSDIHSSCMNHLISYCPAQYAMDYLLKEPRIPLMAYLILITKGILSSMSIRIWMM